MDNSYPQVSSRRRGPDVHRLAAHLDGSLVGRLHAGKDVNQSGLAGSVLTEQSVDLSAGEANRDAVVCDHSPEALDDSANRHAAPVVKFTRGGHSRCRRDLRPAS